MSDIEDHKILTGNLVDHLSGQTNAVPKLIETHISSIILHRNFAYKIKKPVNFGFLDFTRLDARKFYCEEEIRLNSRLAPNIYLSTVKICGSLQQPELEGNGIAIEYAVKMVRFDQSSMLNHLLEKNRLPLKIIDHLALQIAQFHQSIAVSSASHAYATPERVIAAMLHNFEHIRGCQINAEDEKKLEIIEQWTHQQFTRLTPQIEQRRRDGFIRECHGDMHMGNMFQSGQSVIIFDGIEFNDDLRWIDVMSELAFISMDFMYRGAVASCYRLIRLYLEKTGDYAGLELLRFYQVYRAMVRAKVARLSIHHTPNESDNRVYYESEYQQYIDLAIELTQIQKPKLILMYGLSGSGKSTVSAELVERLGAIRIRSDEVRKRIFNNHSTDITGSLNRGLYDPIISEKTYQHLHSLTNIILQSEYNVIVDATFLKKSQRAPFQALAEQLSIPFCIVQLDATLDILHQRVQQRCHDNDNISDANSKVITLQQHAAEAPQPDEPHIVINTSIEIDYVKLLLQLNKVGLSQ